MVSPLSPVGLALLQGAHRPGYRSQKAASHFIINTPESVVNSISPATLSLIFIISDTGSQSHRKLDADVNAPVPQPF
jgi:hypothetical protein